MTIRWLCARCAKKESATVDDVEPILKACSVCGVENYVRPVGGPDNETVTTEEQLEAETVVKESLQEESPEETAPAEAVEPIEEEVAVESPEADPEPKALDKMTKAELLEHIAEMAKNV